MKNFADRLIERINDTDSVVVMGLDPTLENIPAIYKSSGASVTDIIFDYNARLIDAAAEFICAVKPQLAYYEALGLEGLAAFDQTVRYAKRLGIPVIADGKRNDIGSTSAAYAKAFLSQSGGFDCDALTVNPYLGEDGLSPFIDACVNDGRGIFALVKTSNPSSGQLQDLKFSDGETVYEKVARLVSSLGERAVGEHGYSAVGAVVGATYPSQAAGLRTLMKNTIFLVPGYGAQGGDADSVRVNFNSDGLGAVVNASRSIMNAYKSAKWAGRFGESEFAAAAAAEARDMRDALNKVRKQK